MTKVPRKQLDAGDVLFLLKLMFQWVVRRRFSAIIACVIPDFAIGAWSGWWLKRHERALRLVSTYGDRIDLLLRIKLIGGTNDQRNANL